MPFDGSHSSSTSSLGYCDEHPPYTGLQHLNIVVLLYFFQAALLSKKATAFPSSIAHWKIPLTPRRLRSRWFCEHFVGWQQQNRLPKSACAGFSVGSCPQVSFFPLPLRIPFFSCKKGSEAHPYVKSTGSGSNASMSIFSRSSSSSRG